ncbi:hypothetical protein COLO4_37242 [Corchorus olitorius]|uniref:Uncharacterized protein n=1 Tax=Corchorus olitorius TaxID=93759 RepID=A0A1R3G2R4_9ROSI|nr:hypothetical protein COLO4_37242 [Corchorus olitorius]
MAIISTAVKFLNPLKPTTGNTLSEYRLQPVHGDRKSHRT